MFVPDNIRFEDTETIEDTGTDQLYSANWEIGPEINEENSPLPPELDTKEAEIQELDNDWVLKAQFLEKVAQLYNDFFLRIELQNWKALFDSNVIWNINSRNVLSNELVDFFAKHHYLPPEVWKFIDDCFGWSKQKDAYDSQVPTQLIEYITGRITGSGIIYYSAFNKIAGFDYERFLNSREHALSSSMDDILGELFAYYRDNAEAVYPDDPQLPAFLGRYYYKSQDFLKAIDYLNRAIELNPTDQTLPVLQREVYQKIKTGLRKDFLKKPWRKDLVKQYYVVSKEIRSWEKVNEDPILFWLKKQNPVLLRVFLGVLMCILIINDIPIKLKVAKIKIIRRTKNVSFRFEHITTLDLTCININGSEKNQYFLRYNPRMGSLASRVAVGRLKRKEIIFVVEKPEYFKTGQEFIGLIYDLSPQMLETVKQELIRINAPPEIVRNLVTSRYIVVKEEMDYDRYSSLMHQLREVFK